MQTMIIFAAGDRIDWRLNGHRLDGEFVGRYSRGELRVAGIAPVPEPGLVGHAQWLTVTHDGQTIICPLTGEPQCFSGACFEKLN